MAIQSVGAAQAVDIAKMTDALSEVLKNAQEKSLALSQKLVKLNVLYKVGDPALGTRIDTTA